MSTFKAVYPLHKEEYLKQHQYLTDHAFDPGKVYDVETIDSTHCKVIDGNGEEVICLINDFNKVPQILDTGARRSFTSGAVRDIDESKGRCDLMPLSIVSKFLNNDVIIGYLNDFKESTYKDTDYLDLALREFCESAFGDDETELLLEVSMHFKQGAEKYGENNWQKGLPIYCYLDSAIRHYLKYLRGDKDERHDRAFVWNIMCMWWTVDKEIDIK